MNEDENVSEKKEVEKPARPVNDSLISKGEWKNYCGQLKQINTELGKLATKQHEDIGTLISVVDLPAIYWLIHVFGVRKQMRLILDKYRDGKVEEVKVADDHSEKGTAEKTKA